MAIGSGTDEPEDDSAPKKLPYLRSETPALSNIQ